MSNMNQIIADIEEYKKNGGDINALLSSAQTLAATGKTPLGLNQWVKSDKPSMADFNEDNRIIDEEIRALKANKPDKSYVDAQLANKVNITPPQRYNLPVSEGFEITHAGHYWKTSFGLVTVTFEIIKKQPPFGPGGYCIATLPVGFRPVGYLAHFNAVTRGSSGFQSTYAYVTTEGAINVNLDKVNGEIAGTISFYTE